MEYQTSMVQYPVETDFQKIGDHKGYKGIYPYETG
jgi:hypothetical protein